ncbi:hypothetical protein HBI56_119290 [Parastagonospora nodorum]|uniref:Uncharacterized protein n=1 Tax=Phaeosphaeria nodorum (strain SN15 / ATCC MYA-4574 / FGSC 10173) TaxID=321614 RepID=A0A7U2I7G9_PHANO|nr:hypothetical protein HBH56_055480 [Parastagonospora nodorum]QRD02403.1 hypothetical protein JI435_417930 [Parastagonospora nodorum SN15]KAH3935948.1 hypothetical protein HBH54_041290 [Parastagonospora nodorum]KAH3948558.1 hypothetical protein HBH53_098030 [Parastagonospora nodorum]KAH3969868.1 hypothetical protein HBH51_121420 [Parastagonospora nodorum]
MLKIEVDRFVEFQCQSYSRSPVHTHCICVDECRVCITFVHKLYRLRLQQYQRRISS